MKSAGCSAGGFARQKRDKRSPALTRDFNRIERRLPCRRETEIVVALVVPVVVDVETLVVEIADVDVIAVRVAVCPFPSMTRFVRGTGPRGLLKEFPRILMSSWS